MVHFDRLSAISLTLPMICTVLSMISAWVVSINMLLAMAARVRSLVLPEFRTETTAWLSQAILTALPHHC